jgi:hypothetical protein
MCSAGSPTWQHKAFAMLRLLRDVFSIPIQTAMASIGCSNKGHRINLEPSPWDSKSTWILQNRLEEGTAEHPIARRFDGAQIE